MAAAPTAGAAEEELSSLSSSSIDVSVSKDVLPFYHVVREGRTESDPAKIHPSLDKTSR